MHMRNHRLRGVSQQTIVTDARLPDSLSAVMYTSNCHVVVPPLNGNLSLAALKQSLNQQFHIITAILE